MAVSNPEEILKFWFGELNVADNATPETRARWFKKDDGFDREIVERFGATIEAAAAGELDSWTETAGGSLALVIVCDQFSRNAHRGTPASFAQDERARAHVRAMFDSGQYDELLPIRRAFAIMPLMHAEDSQLQAECVQRFEALAEATDGALSEQFANFAHYGRKHQEIVDRFGRFPHRNEILGRDSTEEEHEFLTQPGSSF